MTTSHIAIKCPQCGHEFDISDVLYHEVEHELKQEYEARLKTERDKFRSQSEALERQREQLEADREAQDEIVTKAIREQVQQARKLLEKKLAEEIREEQSDVLKALREELDQKSEQVKGLNKAQAEIERLKREKEEIEGNAEAAMERRLSQQLAEARQQIRDSEEEKSAKQIAERAFLDLLDRVQRVIGLQPFLDDQLLDLALQLH